jgi:hypothetical protein
MIKRCHIKRRNLHIADRFLDFLDMKAEIHVARQEARMAKIGIGKELRNFLIVGEGVLLGFSTLVLASTAASVPIVASGALAIHGGSVICEKTKKALESRYRDQIEITESKDTQQLK